MQLNPFLWLTEGSWFSYIPLRQAADKLQRLLTKLTQEAAIVPEAVKNTTVAVLKSLMVSELKTYVDLSRTTEKQQF